ncbi:1261_t:CDS:2, partial [Gigaspora margarita]
VFCFDQSTNHNAYTLDALVCSRITLHPKVEPKFKFKDSWFICDHQKIVQPMFFFDKGRNNNKGIWNGQKLDYKRKKDDEK